jgi:AcrR family transcriptional regulator
MMDGSPHTAQADARTRILDAAEALVRSKGVAGLTLEAAARLAGVSKGGLLYHFASKEALLTGLIARMAEFIRQDFAAGIAAQPDGPGRVARAMLAWGFGQRPGAMPEDMNERCDRAAAVFLATFHHDPALLDPIRAVIAGMRRRVCEDGLPPGIGGLVMAAGDGLFMARIFGMYTPTPEEMGTMHATLSRLIEEALP